MWSILTNNWNTFLSGLGFTLAASILALIGSLIVGTLFALMEISPFKPLRVIGRIYVEVVRNIPLLVITLAFYVIVPQFIVKIDGFTAGTIGLLIYRVPSSQKPCARGLKQFPAARWKVRGVSG